MVIDFIVHKCSNDVLLFISAFFVLLRGRKWVEIV